MFRPFSAEARSTGAHERCLSRSASRRRYSSPAVGPRSTRSHLLTTTTQAFFASTIAPAMCASWSVTSSVASRTSTQTSARPIARFERSTLYFSRSAWMRPRRRIPAVSTSTQRSSPRENGRVDGVPRRARRRVDDDAVLPEQRVDQGGLADVRPPDEGDPDRLRPGVGHGRGLREGLQDLGHHVVETDRVLRRHRVDPVDAEAVEIERERLARRAVDLVGEHEDLAGKPRQHRARQLLVERGQALDGVGHEEDDVGIGERGGGLVADLDGHRVVGEKIEAAGVDDR